MNKIVFISVALVLLIAAFVAGRTTFSGDHSRAISASRPGFDGNIKAVTLKIEGMWCASCAVGAEYALKEKQGIVEAMVDFQTATGKVTYNPRQISQEEIVSAVLPYEASVVEEGK